MVSFLTAVEFFPFTGLNPGLRVLFLITFVIVVAMFAWTVVLFVRGLRSDRELARRDGVDPDRFDWVFLVPALNEEVTIADSVGRLDLLEVERKRIVVINDGSDDRTAEILGSLDVPGLIVLERRSPEARQGKAAALNFAFHELEARFELEPENTILCVVDADGRIAPESPGFVARHFVDPEVGGVQTLVRIYNRHRILTWFQDLEFSIYGKLFQAGRTRWGTAGMGGNGQYNRMAALQAIDDRRTETEGAVAGPEGPEPELALASASRGPWRDRLTEDQDLGLRLMCAGWRCEQDNQATVEQQGLPGLRRLFRQRTRWSQGNLQAIGLIDDVVGSRLFLPARIEQVVFLLMPILQMVIGASFVASIYLWLFADVRFFTHADRWWWLYLLYLLGFGGTVMGSIAAKTGDRLVILGVIKGILTGQVYAFYTWLLWPVLLRSSARQLIGRGTWAKTPREQIDPAGGEGMSSDN
ncbi:MAG: glycosyltransferase [Solirubrobacterales bacterium]|nr:glycosyltransferase [Solirubrobacterales bacterium]